MRLIDADALLYTWANSRPCTGAEYVAIVKDAPTIDAEPVIRCKDCKHWLHDVAGCTDVVGRCRLANYMIEANGYCLYGEVVEDEAN